MVDHICRMVWNSRFVRGEQKKGKTMSDDVKITISGNVSGYQEKTATLAGSGKLLIEIPDITKSSVSVDYKEEDKLKLSLESIESLKFTADQSLKFTGDVGYDFFKKTVDGKIGIDFDMSKNVAMTFGQEFGKKDGTTSASITLCFG
jgi:hypothetical protein